MKSALVFRQAQTRVDRAETHAAKHNGRQNICAFDIMALYDADQHILLD